MKGYIQGIASENLGQHNAFNKTHLWFAPIAKITLENGICEFSYKWDLFSYNVKATTNNDFNYVGIIEILGYESEEIRFDHYKNRNRNLLNGNYMEGGVDFRIIVEAS